MICSGFGARHLQCLLIFIGLTSAMMQRVNLSIAIVGMTDKNSTNPNFEEYQWSAKTKSYVLSSFSWGYFLMQIPGSHLAHRFGGKVMLLGCIGLSGILALLSPLSARIGDWKLFCALRLTQGLMQGSIFSSIHTLLSKWVPLDERGSLGTICYSGLTFGSVVMLMVSGWIASSPFGWPGIFYFCGIISIIWSLIWYFLGASTPSHYKWISDEEKSYIERALSSTTKSKHQPMQTPWLKIFTSVPFWVLLFAQSTSGFSFWLLITQIPSYMNSVLGQDIKSSALMSAAPYLASLVSTALFCFSADFLIKHRYTSINTSRKLFNSIGFWVPVAPIILLGYMRSDQSQLAVVLLVIAVGSNTASGLGFLTNHIDLSPNFAGILMGLCNCAANIMGFLAPITVGIIVTDAKNVNQWRIVFYIAGGLYFIGNLLFLIFGKTKIQKWNYPKNQRMQRDHIEFNHI